MDAKTQKELTELLGLERPGMTASESFAKASNGFFYQNLRDINDPERAPDEQEEYVSKCGGCDLCVTCLVKGFVCCDFTRARGRWKRVDVRTYADGLTEIRGNPT